MTGNNMHNRQEQEVRPVGVMQAPLKVKFSTIRQGTATNNLTKINHKDTVIDPITGTATVTKGNFTLTIPNYAQLPDLKTSAYQLLDAITIALTESGAKSPTVTIPLSHYMNRRGLKDRKEAKNQVKADLAVLSQTSITGEEKQGGKIKSYAFVNIADSGEIKRNGDIVFTFGNTFFQMLSNYAFMPYPAQLQTINNRKNPNSYYFLRKIAEHKYMNSGRQNENIISVKTLLSVAPTIPTYEELMASNDRHVDNRIIQVFERDMDVLNKDSLTWEYCHTNNTPLTEEELKNMDYKIFENLLIKITWKEYPDQTARLERKAERIKKAEKNKSKKRKSKE